MFEGFEVRDVAGPRGRIHLRTGGGGPPLLLLHGYPQTHLCWHRLAPKLAERFTLVMPDLPGYGQSEGPPADGGTANYAKRAIAADMVALMAALGHARFHLAGHDRGARTAYRLALDSPERVDRLVLLDIVPTAVQWQRMTAEGAMRGFHWPFLAQPAPLPERLIHAEPEAFIGGLLDRWVGAPDAFTAEARAAYVDQYRRYSVVEASCEDYRAGWGPDRANDEADRAAGRRIAAPTLVLYGRRCLPDPTAVWQEWCEAVEVRGLDCSHFIAEEKPDEAAAAFAAFLAG